MQNDFVKNLGFGSVFCLMHHSLEKSRRWSLEKGYYLGSSRSGCGYGYGFSGEQGLLTLIFEAGLSALIRTDFWKNLGPFFLAVGSGYSFFFFTASHRNPDMAMI